MPAACRSAGSPPAARMRRPAPRSVGPNAPRLPSGPARGYRCARRPDRREPAARRRLRFEPAGIAFPAGRAAAAAGCFVSTVPSARSVPSRRAVAASRAARNSSSSADNAAIWLARALDRRLNTRNLGQDGLELGLKLIPRCGSARSRAAARRAHGRAPRRSPHAPARARRPTASSALRRCRQEFLEPSSMRLMAAVLFDEGLDVPAHRRQAPLARRAVLPSAAGSWRVHLVERRRELIAAGDQRRERLFGDFMLDTRDGVGFLESRRSTGQLGGDLLERRVERADRARSPRSTDPGWPLAPAPRPGAGAPRQWPAASPATRAVASAT